MKRYGHLFPRVIDKKNIASAMHSASLGKRHYREVAKYLNKPKETINNVRNMLINGTYKPSHVKETKINERGKMRIITSSKFYPDQIIHWALMNVLSPIFLKSMYAYNIATIPGRGGGLGEKKLVKWLSKDPKHTKYCLKTDIRHFYPSINHSILKQKLLHRFKDPYVLKILFNIIDCYPTGLPLGLYTSQWLANFFLESVDHCIKEEYRVPYYVRYMDDMVFLGPNKRKLHLVEKGVNRDLHFIDLHFKPNWYIAPVDSRFIDFMGFKFYRDHVGIRRRDFLRIRRKAKSIYKKGILSLHDARSMVSYWGWIKHSDSYYFYNHDVKPYVSIKECKEVLKNGGTEYLANL